MMHQELPATGELCAHGWVDVMTWLDDRVLLIIGWFHVGGDERAEIFWVVDDFIVPTDVQYCSYFRPDVGDDRGGKLITIHFPYPEMARVSRATIVVRTRDAIFVLNPQPLTSTVTDLRTLILDQRLFTIPPEARPELMGLFSTFLTRTVEGGLPQLKKTVAVIRKLFSQSLARTGPPQSVPQWLAVDAVLAIDERSFCVIGWMRDQESQRICLTAISPLGEHVDLTDTFFRYQRDDIIHLYAGAFESQPMKDGFLCFFQLTTPCHRIDNWVFQMRNSYGRTMEVKAPLAVRDPVSVRTQLLLSPPIESLGWKTLFANHLGPAFAQIQERRRGTIRVASDIQYGLRPGAPIVSLVVPLYQRVDFLEQQIANFADDPMIRHSDLIYVLDSPADADRLRDEAVELFHLYRVPFRLLVLGENAGYSASNNIGASFARGRLLLLLNSDVIPTAPHWLENMVAFHDATPAIGALGPKLVYPDESLQHAGMYFSRLPDDTWQSMHFFKGFHRSLPAANVARPVPAVTGACMLIDRMLFHEIGGLAERYVQGDFEDSDLCLRLTEAGYTNWYLPTVDLYHLEGQSYPTSLRQRTTLFNRWLFTQQWDAAIGAMQA